MTARSSGWRSPLSGSRPDRGIFRVGVAFGVLLLGTNLPSPLYHIYQNRFGFSTSVVTLIFAAQALVVVPVSLGLGSLSDRVGRRPVSLAVLVLAAVGCCLFAVADGTAWLFAARACQGAAVGAGTGALTAALLDMEPSGDQRRAAQAASLAGAGGVALGPLVSGVLVEWAPAPLALPYAVELVLLGGVALALPAGRQTTGPAPAGWRPHWPRVPAGLRAATARAIVVESVVWAVTALFLAVGAPYAADLLDTDNHALYGVVAFAMLAASCVAQLTVGRTGPHRAQISGLLLTVPGVAMLVLAFPMRSLVVLMAGAVTAGIGHGRAFQGSQQSINDLAPSDARAELNSAYYCGIYLAVALSAIGVGLVADATSLVVAVRWFAAGIAAAGLAAVVWLLSRQRFAVSVQVPGQ
jgi:MFS family permease